MRAVDVKANPAGVAVAPDGATVWVANSGSAASGPAATVTVLDAVTCAVQSIITVGAGPQDIAFAPGRARAFVTNSTQATVSVVDTRTRATTQTVDLARVPMKWPFGITVDRAETKAFVTGAGGWRDASLGHVAILDITDPAHVTVAGAVAVSGFTGRPAVSPTGGVVIVPRSREGGPPPGVMLIDVVTGRIVDELYADSVKGAVFDVAVTPDGLRAYAGLFGGAGGVWTIDLRAWRTLRVLPTTDARVHGVGISRDGRCVAVTNFGSASVSIISTETDEMVATVAVGRAPNDVAVTADDTRAFVTNQAETTVSVIALPERS